MRKNELLGISLPGALGMILCEAYILRIATPLEFRPYWREQVRIEGTAELDDIVLERIIKTLQLPATPEVESEVSGEELVWSLPGRLRKRRHFIRYAAEDATPSSRSQETLQ